MLILFSCNSPGGYVAITGYAQGGTYTVKINLSPEDGRVSLPPEKIKEGIDSVLLAIDNSLSGYNKGSLISRFNRGETIVPDAVLTDIYALSYKFYESSGGAFDVAAAPLFDIWGFGFEGDNFPEAAQVEKVRALCGMGLLLPRIEDALDGSGHLSPQTLLRGDAPAGTPLPKLNFNAIAQGYSCDLVASYLYSLGVRDMLVDVGGEIFCDGLNPSGRPWTVGVDRPEDGNDIPGAKIEGTMYSGGRPCGIVTSGNYRKFYIRDGRKYAHTIDPRTGWPVSHSLLSATVIASDAATADALATICMVIGYTQAREMLESSPDLRGCLIYEEGGEMLSWTSAPKQ